MCLLAQDFTSAYVQDIFELEQDEAYSTIIKELNGEDGDEAAYARGMTGRTFKVVAKKAGADFVFGNPCQKEGHRLKARSSAACIQCNPAYIAYQKLNAAKAKGIVYIAHSDTLGQVKVGCCWPNLAKRIQNLRGHRYGGASDWTLVFEIQVKAMGLVEGKAHKRLAAYAVEGEAYRGGQVASELFNCSIDTAIEALKAEV